MKKWSQWLKTTTVFQLFDAKFMGENERNWFQMQSNLMCGRKMIYICEKKYEKSATGPLKTILFKLSQYLLKRQVL